MITPVGNSFYGLRYGKKGPCSFQFHVKIAYGEICRTVKITYGEMSEVCDNNVTEPLWYKVRLHTLVLRICNKGPLVEEPVVKKRAVGVRRW